MHSGRSPEPPKAGPPAHTPAPQRTGASARGAAPPHPSVPTQNGPPPFVAHYGFPFARQGDRIKVDIDTSANVLLVNDEGFDSYRRHVPFHYIGGGYGPGTHVLGVPSDGSWHVIVDLGGRPGHVTHHAAITHHDDPVQPR